MNTNNYILFDNYNTFKDFQLFIQSLEISEAEAKTELVDIPGADGFLDFSRSLAGEVKFKNRKIIITLSNRKGKIYFQEYSRIQNALHGKFMQIRLSKDLNFYYYGKVSVSDFKVEKVIRTIKIVCDIEPYKRDLFASNEDWEWDTFDFETGIINETKDLKVNGELELTILGRRKKVVPKIVCDNPLQLIFNGQTYNLLSGINLVPDVEICEGDNKLKFVGNGIVTIEYRGGSL